jgi:hypothetical protein
MKFSVGNPESMHDSEIHAAVLHRFGLAHKEHEFPGRMLSPRYRVQ